MRELTMTETNGAAGGVLWVPLIITVGGAYLYEKSGGAKNIDKTVSNFVEGIINWSDNYSGCPRKTQFSAPKC